MAKPARDPTTRKVKDWIDVLAYGGTTVMRGLVPLSAFLLGGVESAAPDLIRQVNLSQETSHFLFYGSIGYFAPGFFRGSGKRRQASNG
jgi:hypothetical protein